MKHWEIIADNLSKAGRNLVRCRPLIPKDARSGLLTRMATENVALCVPKKVEGWLATGV